MNLNHETEVLLAAEVFEAINVEFEKVHKELMEFFQFFGSIDSYRILKNIFMKGFKSGSDWRLEKDQKNLDAMIQELTNKK